MIIGGNKRLKQIDLGPHIHMRGSRLDRVKTTKSLGLMIDETLIWSAQVDQIAGKVNSGLDILRRLRDIVDYQTLIMIYLSMSQPHFDYCSQVWGCLGKGLSDKLQKRQNRAFRNGLFSDLKSAKSISASELKSIVCKLICVYM